MKKHRKQLVNVFGQKLLVDVPVDGELYKMDRRAEYQDVRSKTKHVFLDDLALADHAADVAEIYEEAQLLERLREALLTLDEDERMLVEYYYYGGLNESETADRLKITQPAVNKKKRNIIQKLRNSLIDWL